MKTSSEHIRQRRGSVIDLLVIFLIVLSIVGFLWRQHRIERAKEQEGSKLYTFYAQSVAMDAMTLDCIGIGDLLYTSSGDLFGEITALERIPSEVRLLSDGAYYVGEWDEAFRGCVRVEISVRGTPTDRGVLVAGHRNTVGGTLPRLYSERASLGLTLYRMNAANP